MTTKHKFVTYELGHFRPAKLVREYEQRLFGSLCLPSTAQSYSMCIEYVKGWFMSKFKQEYFKSVYLDGKHISEDFRRLSKTEMLKRLKPALVITPSIDLSFDRERLDMYYGGLDNYLNMCSHKDAFYKDKSRDVCIGTTLEMIMMNFNFKIKVSTRMQAIDLYKFMKQAFRVGTTHGKDVDMDFHVPKSLMLQLAEDCGFAIKDNEVVKPIEFIGYVNKWSVLPFTYKYTSDRGHREFFVRMKDVYVHLSPSEINCDDGEREGQIMSNFNVDMQVAVRFPCPKFYAYFSYKQHDTLQIKDHDGTLFSYSTNFGNIPTLNSKGWGQLLYTQYMETDRTKPMKIEFGEIMGDIREVVDHTKKMFLSPDLFIEIKLYNNLKERSLKVDWDNYIITMNELMEDEISYIVVFVDIKYLNNQIINMKEYKKNRLK